MIKRILGRERKAAVNGSRLTRFLYNIAFFIFSLIYLPLFFIKGKHKDGFGSRLGLWPPELRKSLVNKKVVWVHAVSVGEAVQAVRLVNALREKLRDCRFLLTTTTAMGREVAQKLKNDEDALLYFPLDFRRCVRTFIKNASWEAVIILETEIWPNLILELTNCGVPVAMVNGRISDKAIGKYRMVKGFVGPLLNRLNVIAVQDELMRSRFLELGVDPDLVSVTGNMKFDWGPESRHDEFVEGVEGVLKRPGSFLCIAGSTHEGEEEILFEVYKSLKAKFPSFRLLVAPRHVDRIASIENRAAKKGVKTQRISEVFRDKKAPAGEEAVWILDQMGVLANLYRLADIVFIGGSLVDFGGHNLVEPAFFEKAIIFGPYMNNFVEMSDEFRKADAAVEVKDRNGLEKALAALIQDPERRRALGEAARRLVLRHQGATHRNIDILLTSIKF